MSVDLADAPYDVTPAPSNSEHVSDVYASLMTSFCSILLQMDADSDLPDSPILESAYEECTRLRIWGLQNRVSAPSDTPGSLGRLLKERPGVEKLVFEVLRDANASLSSMLQDMEAGEVIPLDEISEPESDSDASWSSDSSSPPGLITYLKRAFANIEELYRLQSLLRKPRTKGKYLHSGQIRPDLPGYQQDYQHVRQKLDDWRRSPDSSFNEEKCPESELLPMTPSELDDAPGMSPDLLLQRQQSEQLSEDLTDVLCRRLAIANSKRRKQLKYWQSYPYQQPQEKPVEVLGQNRRVKIVAAKGLVEKPKQATSHSDAPTSSKVPTTVHSFSTAPRSAIMIDEDSQIGEAIARTTYKPSVIGTVSSSAIRVPDMPQTTENSETPSCPYCLAPLSSEVLSSRENWKRHVFRDLRPYVCTAYTCTDPDKQFATRYDWIYHETQLHHRQWPCSECQDVFETGEAFQTHCIQSHNVGWTKRQVDILSNIRERAKDDTALSICPLCSFSMQHSTLLEHVADHLEELSLFSLPRIATKDDNDDLAVPNEARESGAAEDMAKAENTSSKISIEDAVDIEWTLEELSSSRSESPISRGIPDGNPLLKPDTIEYPDSSRSTSPSSLDRGVPEDMLTGMANVSFGDDSDISDSEYSREELTRHLRYMREQRKQRRMTMGSFNKRTVSERDSDSGGEDLQRYDDVRHNSQRRIRRKLNYSRSSLISDPRDIIFELAEPSSNNEGVGEGDGNGDGSVQFWRFVEVEEAE